MAEYIEREKLMEKFCWHCEATACGDDECFYKRTMYSIPAADVQPVTHCKDCVYRPYYEPSDSKSVSDLVFPDYRFNPCPCRVEDIWYSWMPDDDWFCAYGKRKDGET